MQPTKPTLSTISGILMDERLSFTARGVLLLILVTGEGQPVRMKTLAKFDKQGGLEAIRAAFDELIALGLVFVDETPLYGVVVDWRDRV